MQLFTIVISFISGVLITVITKLHSTSLVLWSAPYFAPEPTFVPDRTPASLTLPPTEDYVPPALPQPPFLQEPYCGYWERSTFIHAYPSNLSNNPVPGEDVVDGEGRVVSCIPPPWPQDGWHMIRFRAQRWCQEQILRWWMLFTVFTTYVSTIFWWSFGLAIAVMVTASFYKQCGPVDVKAATVSKDLAVTEERSKRENAERGLRQVQEDLETSRNQFKDIKGKFEQEKDVYETKMSQRNEQIEDLKRQLGTIDYIQDPARIPGVSTIDTEVNRLPTLVAQKEMYRHLFYQTKVELDVRDVEIKVAKDEVLQLQDTLGQDQKQFAEHLKRKIENLRTERDDAIAGKRKLENEYSTTIVAFEGQVEEIDKLQIKVTEFKAKLNGRENELQALRLELSAISTENERLQDRVKQLEGEREAVMDDNEVIASHPLETDLEELACRLDEVTQQFKESQGDYTRLTREHEELQRDRQTLHTQYAEKQAQFTKLTEEHEILLADKQTLDTRYSELEGQATKLIREHEELQADKGTLQGRIKESNQEVTDGGREAKLSEKMPEQQEDENSGTQTFDKLPAEMTEHEEAIEATWAESVFTPRVTHTSSFHQNDRKYPNQPVVTSKPTQNSPFDQPVHLTYPFQATRLDTYIDGQEVTDKDDEISSPQKLMKAYVTAVPRPRLNPTLSKELKNHSKGRHACWRCENQGHIARDCPTYQAQQNFLWLRHKYATLPGGIAELERRIRDDLCYACGATDHSHEDGSCAGYVPSIQDTAGTFTSAGPTASKPVASSLDPGAPPFNPAPLSFRPTIAPFQPLTTSPMPVSSIITQTSACALQTATGPELANEPQFSIALKPNNAEKLRSPRDASDRNVAKEDKPDDKLASIAKPYIYTTTKDPDHSKPLTEPKIAEQSNVSVSELSTRDDEPAGSLERSETSEKIGTSHKDTTDELTQPHPRPPAPSQSKLSDEKPRKRTKPTVNPLNTSKFAPGNRLQQTSNSTPTRSRGWLNQGRGQTGTHGPVRGSILVRTPRTPIQPPTHVPFPRTPTQQSQIPIHIPTQTTLTPSGRSINQGERRGATRQAPGGGCGGRGGMPQPFVNPFLAELANMNATSALQGKLMLQAT